MEWIDAELALVALAAMLSPTTLSFSTLALVIGDRPLRTGWWFYTGALGATLAIGILAAFVIGDAAASGTGTPRTAVAILDVVAAAVLIGYVVRVARQPRDPRRQQAMIERMSGLATASVLAIAGAGAVLANPGGFIPLALKDISETDPTPTQYAVEWLFFAVVSLLPLGITLILLVVSKERTLRMLASARGWLERNARMIALGIILLLAATLLRNGIAGLTA